MGRGCFRRLWAGWEASGCKKSSRDSASVLGCPCGGWGARGLGGRVSGNSGSGSRSGSAATYPKNRTAWPGRSCVGGEGRQRGEADKGRRREPRTVPLEWWIGGEPVRWWTDRRRGRGPHLFFSFLHWRKAQQYRGNNIWISLF